LANNSLSSCGVIVDIKKTSKEEEAILYEERPAGPSTGTTEISSPPSTLTAPILNALPESEQEGERAYWKEQRSTQLVSSTGRVIHTSSANTTTYLSPRFLARHQPKQTL